MEIPQSLFDIVIDVPVVGRAVFILLQARASARAVRTWNLYIISWPGLWLSLVRCICRLRSTFFTHVLLHARFALGICTSFHGPDCGSHLFGAFVA